MATCARTTFDLADFIHECLAAIRDAAPLRALHAVVARAVSDPSGMLAALGQERRAQILKGVIGENE